MAGPPKTSDEDRALFRASVGAVRRLHDDRVRPAPRPRPEPVPGPRRDSEPPAAAAPERERGERLEFLRPGLQQRLLRRLRRGQIKVEDELDLHGLTVRTARTRLDDFLAQAKGCGLTCVRIVPGKGRGSAGGRAVLKSAVDGWLRARADVLAFTSPGEAEGGTGAVHVLLSAPKE